MTLAGLLKAAPYIAIAALLVGNLATCAAKAKVEGELERQQLETEIMAEVAKTNAETIKNLDEGRKANDAIVQQLAQDVAAIKAQGVKTRETVREIYRADPAGAGAWASQPVPSGVRDALNGD